MTFSAHDRTLLFDLMAAFAVQMEGPSQSRLAAGIFFSMAVGASLIFRGFVCYSLAVFINVMTFIAFLNPSGFIVCIMSKNRRRSPLVLKTIPLNHHHIFLGKYGDNQKKRK
jgi:hypothetical protein